MRKLTKEEFILKSMCVHGDRYDYSLVRYINCMSKIIIICKKHGRFEQSPTNHINGHICKKCSIEIISSNQRKNIEFIKKSNIKYNYKYDYTKVDYKNRITKVIITCPTHGDFLSTPVNHLSSRNGCSKCSKSDIRRVNMTNFLEKSKVIHNYIYDYSKVEYKSDKIKVKITCSKHGDFMQQPNTHVNGIGCPKCSSSKGELKILDFLEKNKIIYEKEYKFTNCYYINDLIFDFYLPIENICIEYDGRQHFDNIEFFGGDTGLKETKIRDSIKNEYCINNNIRIIRIPYTEFNSIEKILSNIWESYQNELN